MSKREELIAFVESLTPEQVDNLTKHLPLLEQVADLSKNEAIFAERFLSRVCGKETA